MSVAGGGAVVAPAGEACPLCGAPLHPQQEWCLRCGAAARTRLAPSPNWRLSLAALGVVVVLSLGVLAAALVKLAGSGDSTSALTRTVTGASAPAAAPTTPAPGVLSPGAASSAPAAPTAPTTGTSTSGAASGGPAGGASTTSGAAGSSPTTGAGKTNTHFTVTAPSPQAIQTLRSRLAGK